MILPEEYVAQKFYQYTKKVTRNKSSGILQGVCSLCEDAKQTKKRRCYYIPKRDLVYCFHCGWSSKPLKWIQEVSGQTRDEILEESKSYDLLPPDFFRSEVLKAKDKIPSLPHDSINLFDSSQLQYYKDNSVVQDTLSLIKARCLDIAVNRPQTIWLSLDDMVHCSRLIIPFYDISGSIIYYQSRALYNTADSIKYLSKSGGDRSLYNINKISPNLEYIFVTEGPIDAFFLQNGTCTCGITETGDAMFTDLQQRQIDLFKFHQVIWCLDSQYLDKTSYLKTKRLIDLEQKVFIWPEELGRKYKDFNDYCMDKRVGEFDYQVILSNTFSGLQAKLRMTTV